MKEKEKQFMAGFGVAISYLVRCWKKEEMAVMLAKEAGFDKEDFRFCDTFDLEIINKLDWGSKL